MSLSPGLSGIPANVKINFYQPAKWLSFRGDIDQTTTGTFYTRISPHTDFGGRLVVHVHPLEKLSFDDSLVIRNLRLVAADYRSSVRGNSSTVTWEWTRRLDTYAGFSYESFFASDFTTFLRGTSPLTDAIRDQTVSRSWQGGIHFRPLQRLTLNFTGNYIRTNGLGEISGEPPLYGPVTFPYASRGSSTLSRDGEHSGYNCSALTTLSRSLLTTSLLTCSWLIGLGVSSTAEELEFDGQVTPSPDREREEAAHGRFERSGEWTGSKVEQWVAARPRGMHTAI